MVAGNSPELRGPGRFILRHRAVIGLALIAATAVMGYWAAQARIATSFENFFPARHQNTLLYRRFQYQYGGAQTMIVLLRVKHGDIFNFKTLNKIEDIHRLVNRLPGVNHNEVFSLASYRVAYPTALPGALIFTCFMYPKVPSTAAELQKLRENVARHREQVRTVITADNKGAVISASFNEQHLDYKALFGSVENIVHRYQDANTEIYVAGVPIVAGWGYYYLPRIALIFFMSIALMLIILYLSLGQRSSWWAPILTGSFSATWGLGFMSLMGYNFDPVMLVIPFILTARDLSHGIQWQGRYYDELDRLDDKTLACITTTNMMLPPGLLSILADIAGIIFIALGGIPVLKEIGLGGAVWLAGSVTMVFVFQPIFMSYLPRPRVRERRWLLKPTTDGLRGRLHRLVAGLIRIPVTPGRVRGAMLVAGGAFIIWGIISGQRARIGYERPGTPLYRPEARVNQDIVEIGKYLPIDEAWVVLATPNYPNEQSSLSPNVLRMIDDMGNYLVNRGDAVGVVSFATQGLMPLNQLFHNGHPKFRAIPSDEKAAGNLWYVFLAGTAPGEMERFFAYSPKMTSTCIRLFLPDHTYARLNQVRADIRRFIDTRVKDDPSLSKVGVDYLGGQAGLYLGANDVLYQLDILNISFVLIVIFMCCALSFRSFVAGLLFVTSAVMANFGAFIYMNARDIGLTIDTIPVISLGIGLGIDYGIYVVARIRDEVMEGASIEQAITTALGTTGAAVFSTFAVMIGGILPWAFSPLLFHNEMSVLLIFLMGMNMIAGVLILPAYIAWRRPRFIARYLAASAQAAPGGHEPQAASAQASPQS
ncbi:MAG TPA: MMPL family transporter [Candidatus Binataceae bacterium]|nr:MMPL family transporter [Candidatus Binataceae bacterium]